MLPNNIDWIIIGLFFVLSALIGFAVAKKSGSSASEFFLSGRRMPWWLLGISLVATTFSADTPNLVTDIVRQNGVAGNWAWWSFLLTGMLTVFVYAKLWRRSGIFTDLEFYELRYGGKPAAFLRGFRALYLGIFFNVMIMATVNLAAIKIGGVMLGLSPVESLLIAGVVTAIYSMFGGFTGVLYTDFFQFIIAMFGAVAAAYYSLSHPMVGGLSKLLATESVKAKLSVMPDFSDPSLWIPVLLVPLAVQWWSTWYPGAEPGGGGYVAQRMLAAKDEKNAVGATLLFNLAHYALRPWPWIIVALCSIIVFPDLASIQSAFPNIDPSIVKDDLAYPAMLTFLPHGILGIVLASLIAAYMSTIATHLNWGSSYIVNDWYKRFMKPEANDKELVNIGRFSTALLMLLSAIVSLYLSNARNAFGILLEIGAGTGLIFILRWFWWRINAWSEIVAMSVSFLFAISSRIFLGDGWLEHEKLILGVVITTTAWVTATLVTQAENKEVLLSFFKRIRPATWGWKPVIQLGLSEKYLTADDIEPSQTKLEIKGIVGGCVCVYGALFTIGNLLYGDTIGTLICLVATAFGTIIMLKSLKKMKFN